MNETYWRSLGELENSESFRKQLEREFPEGASELLVYGTAVVIE